MAAWQTRYSPNTLLLPSHCDGLVRTARHGRANPHPARPLHHHPSPSTCHTSGSKRSRTPLPPRPNTYSYTALLAVAQPLQVHLAQLLQGLFAGVHPCRLGRWPSAPTEHLPVHDDGCNHEAVRLGVELLALPPPAVAAQLCQPLCQKRRRMLARKICPLPSATVLTV